MRRKPISKIKVRKAFRPRARLLALLGEQLIDNARLAVFEMVKNAYDADANTVIVTLTAPEQQSGSISVVDDGSGMTLETLTEVWLEPGADVREIQRIGGMRTPKFKRLPLGEKGVGRFAAHKLGNRIRLWTRAKGGPELHVDVNWAEQIGRRYMDETEISISETDSVYFKKGKTGTRIEITDLKSAWTRGDVRRLWRNVTSISAPFATADDFDVSLVVPGNESWLNELLDVGDILNIALWEYDFCFDADGFRWKYSFKPPPGMGLEGRQQRGAHETLLFPKRLAQEFFEEKPVPNIVPTAFTEGIGPVKGSFYVFDQDREVAAFIPEQSQIATFLEGNGGVRVYRDDIRVYSYGEPGDDWLGLDLRRVNQPTRAISNNNIVGLISLDMNLSAELREKTSRDGFDDNLAYQRLRAIVISGLTHLEGQRTIDKGRMRRVLSKNGQESRISPNSAIAELRKEVEKRSLGPEILKLVDKVGTRVQEMQDTLLRPGATQMHVATLFHEVEHGVRALNAAIRRGEPMEKLQQRSGSLIELLDSFANFFRKTPETRVPASELVRTVCQLNADRFDRHKIILSTPVISKETKDFEILVPRNIVMGAISNILDNSIYWLDQRWSTDARKSRRAIIITTSNYFDEGPALIVADNGPGYRLAPDDILQPFITLKPDGMGIGMYYARLVMEACGGFVAFPEAEDVGLPRAYDGAVTALVFSKGEWIR
ncbi:ATP-binding protein [Iodidimonas sp. SYSU 1G8]|uniref:ATP-binding protein n=1 Tax=Iodidimonas sp. SYSU 1G8 TaxID=3133967 RepID=UPI0031FEAF02